MVNRYTKSKKADADIKEITKYSVLNFGEQQADKYLSGLSETMELLADNPDLGKTLTHPNKYNSTAVQSDHHYYRYISHVIYYRKREDGIFVVRILHKSMLPLNHL